MPVQVMPHMYRMLADEIQWALDDVRSHIWTYDSVLIYTINLERAIIFSHSLIILRTRLIAIRRKKNLSCRAPPHALNEETGLYIATMSVRQSVPISPRG